MDAERTGYSRCRANPTQARNSHAAATLSLEDEAELEQGTFEQNNETEEDHAESTRHWRHCIEETPLPFFVATIDDLVVGYCSLDPDGDEDTSEGVGDISSCYVLPSHWGQGIGRLLSEAALAEARTLGLAELTLTVLEGNQDAQCFYTALGFLPDGTRMTSVAPDGATLHLKRYRKTSS